MDFDLESEGSGRDEDENEFPMVGPPSMLIIGSDGTGASDTARVGVGVLIAPIFPSEPSMLVAGLMSLGAERTTTGRMSAT